MTVVRLTLLEVAAASVREEQCGNRVTTNGDAAAGVRGIQMSHHGSVCVFHPLLGKGCVFKCLKVQAGLLQVNRLSLEALQGSFEHVLLYR